MLQASALAEEIGEMPEVEETGEGKLGTSLSREPADLAHGVAAVTDARDQEIEDYELEHFVRLQDTKADKARRKKNAKITATDAYEVGADSSGVQLGSCCAHAHGLCFAHCRTLLTSRP